MNPRDLRLAGSARLRNTAPRRKAFAVLKRLRVRLMCVPILRVACSAAAIGWMLLTASPVHAQPGQQDNPLSWDRNVRGLFSRYCQSCHKEAEPSGGIDLASDTDPRMILNNRDTWEQVQFVLQDGSMPPADARQPSDEQRGWMLGFLAETLEQIDCQTLNDPGPPPLRRLNRVEYDNAILDLTGLDLSLAVETFPPETSSFGFDNVGQPLAMTPVQVEQYHAAARRVVAELIATKEAAPAAYRRIFGPEGPQDQELRAHFQTLSDRAFRRPAQASWVDRLTELYRFSRAADEDHETALGHVVTAILMAPQFLLRVEQNRPDEEEPYPVDDYELASRLSFFLWSRPPDRQLLELAAKEQLRDPEVLRQQTMRMLADPRSKALVQNFFGQWLGLRGVTTHEVDSDVFPEFDDDLRGAMLAEVEALLWEIIREDRPLSELLDSDYSYLNARLAKHYNLPSDGLSETVQRVQLTDRRRGGVLTSAALLLVQSDPNRTNIPRRGNYIADRILGNPAPPPPPDVPQLEAVTDGGNLTLRELFEKHSASPACAGCHERIDPFGFALENYDALGRWREQDAGQAIDPTGRLPDGRELDGPVALKQMLLESPATFTRTLAKNLLIYALGRAPVEADRCVLDALAAAANQQSPRFSEVVWTIVNSRPFLERRNPEY